MLKINKFLRFVEWWSEFALVNWNTNTYSLSVHTLFQKNFVSIEDENTGGKDRGNKGVRFAQRHFAEQIGTREPRPVRIAP